MKLHILPILASVCILAAASCSGPVAPRSEVIQNTLRAPAYPLVTIDPNTSAWSPSNELYGSSVMHWTEKPFPLVGVATVDGTPYRFMGLAPDDFPQYSQTARQLSADVQATQTHYMFECGPVKLAVDFVAPLFLDRLELISRPVNYIAYEVSSSDGKKHDVTLRLLAGPQWALNKPAEQESVSETYEKDGLLFLKTGSKEQNILGTSGDDVRIDWGYFYLCGEKRKTSATIDKGMLSLERKLGKTSATSGKFMIGYDDIYSVEYFGRRLRPYWNTDGDQTIEGQFAAASRDFEKLQAECFDFDKELMVEATEAGGRKYAELCALAYRQSIAAHKLLKNPDGEGILWLSKENNSNGSIGTVDVTYPSAPVFLRYNPEFVKGLMNHIFYYAESGKWTFPFPAHDAGTYPLANGQTYGLRRTGELRHMPVEESGNMLILAAAVCQAEGKADYAKKHWESLTKWTNYLMDYGMDPEDQYCTDDFAGHLAHNANLSIKAILAIASYGKMAGMLGDKIAEEKYITTARDMAAKWIEMAFDGDHYSLTFDQKGTWSQKYNLVWDKLLGLNIFPESVAKTEIAYYKGVQNTYGLPLDSRATFTKTDWIIWTATMASSQQDFDALVDPVWKFMNETVNRVPMTDWPFTDKPNRRGFKARSVVGGYFIKMLAAQQGL